VLELLGIDPADYAREHTLQPFRGFRVGVLPRRGAVADCGEIVSYGIRRCEFDAYLLRRSGAELALGTPLRSLRRRGARWIANGEIEAEFAIGAGGNFCPVARELAHGNCPSDRLVRAQELEFRLDAEALSRCGLDPEIPEIYFCSDLSGYGWALRKGDYLNVGIGRTGDAPLPAHAESFLAFLRDERGLPLPADLALRGHAYRLRSPSLEAPGAGSLLLVGDAAGLAAPHSGEGIRAAVESGLLAARAIAGANAQTACARYACALRARFGAAQGSGAPSWLPERLRQWLARELLRSQRVARGIVVERWFLQRELPPLAAA
jgi:flavin-dependent dehydrogenase